METTVENKAQTAHQEQRRVDGFLFYTEKDAQLALQEQRKTEYLEKRMDYGKLESVLAIYKKAIQDRVFKTPVGLLYLKKMQQFLQEQPELEGEEIPPIALYNTYDGELRGNTSPARSRVTPSKKKKKASAALPLSILMNITLAIAIIAMFVITLNSEQPNVLNYEKALTNRYAGWEQELTEREQVIREKERELKLGE